jgi:hypothetical protein
VGGGSADLRLIVSFDESILLAECELQPIGFAVEQPEYFAFGFAERQSIYFTVGESERLPVDFTESQPLGLALGESECFTFSQSECELQPFEIPLDESERELQSVSLAFEQPE